MELQQELRLGRHKDLKETIIDVLEFEAKESSQQQILHHTKVVIEQDISGKVAGAFQKMISKVTSQKPFPKSPKSQN